MSKDERTATAAVIGVILFGMAFWAATVIALLWAVSFAQNIATLMP